MQLTGPKETIKKARRLRGSMSKPERLLWWALRGKKTGFHFRRQHPAGPYVLDFYCDVAKLCLEVDDASHDFRVDHDTIRDRWLAEQGVRTIRLGAGDVLRNLDGVVQHIVSQASAPSVTLRVPPPPGGGGVIGIHNFIPALSAKPFFSLAFATRS